jgi:hypothetical protein
MTITILDSIHRPAYHLNHNVSESVFCARFYLEGTQLSLIDRARASFCLRTEVISIYLSQMSLSVRRLTSSVS